MEDISTYFLDRTLYETGAPMKLEEIINSKITIFAHFSQTGATEELRDWLIKNKIRELVYVAFPFLNSKSKSAVVSIYKNGKPVKTKESLIKFKQPEALSYIKDFFYGIIFGIRYCGKSDIIFGGDNLLSIIGVWLRRFGIVKRSVYYMIDYTPVRYKNKLLNWAYYYLDKRAAYKCNVVWTLSEETINGRFRDGRLNRDKVNWIEAPYGNHASELEGQRAQNKQKKYDKNLIVYMGGIVKNKGAELFIPIAEEIAKRKLKYKIALIGGGKYLEILKNEIKDKGLDKYFIVYGYIEEFDRALEILRGCAVAIAPYYPYDKNSFTFFADPGKIKVYLGCGLPVVITDVPPIAKTIEQKEAGLIADYNAVDFADKLMSILSNIKSYRKNALKLGKEFDWNKIFITAFEDIENIER